MQILEKITINFLKVISRLPLFILYFISDILSFISYKLIGYRKKVVIDNMTMAFPNKSEQEIKRLAYKFYSFLSDLIVESIKAFHLSEKEVHRRSHIKNTHILKKYTDVNQPVVLTIGHYNNWELAGIAAGNLEGFHFYSIYKNLKNETIDNYIYNNRQRYGLRLIEEKNARKIVPELLKEKAPNVIVFLADQAKNPANAFWIDFLGLDTTFVKGPEVYAKKYNCPVVHASITKTKRGFYEVDFTVIAENPNETEDGEIMKKYAQLLEAEILNDIPNWLWSHRRWKHTR